MEREEQGDIIAAKQSDNGRPVTMDTDFSHSEQCRENQKAPRGSGHWCPTVLPPLDTISSLAGSHIHARSHTEGQLDGRGAWALSLPCLVHPPLPEPTAHPTPSSPGGLANPGF